MIFQITAYEEYIDKVDVEDKKQKFNNMRKPFK
jgi:hypothetical protein